MAEQLANSATTTLSAAITSAGATTATVTNGSLFPSSGNFRILIDTELILVGARSGNNLSSMTRGIEGTTAATHSNGATVTHLLTKGSLDQYLFERAQVDYVEVTSNQTTTATTAATATAIVTGSAVTYDGATPIWVEFYAGQAYHSVANGIVVADLWDGSTDLGIIALGVSPVVGNGPTLNGRRKLTPSAASHTYSIRAWVTAAGTGNFLAAAGGAGAMMPMYLRISKA